MIPTIYVRETACFAILLAACGGRVSVDDLGGVSGASGGAGDTSTGGVTGTGGTRGGGTGGTGAGGGGGSGAGAAGDDRDGGPRPFRCTSGIVWTVESSSREFMTPGAPCLDCHGPSAKVPFTLAGTIYSFSAANDDDNCNGLDSTFIPAAVAILDEAGNEMGTRMATNASGNFYTYRALPRSYGIRIYSNGRSVDMQAPVTDGNCNSCHTADGRMGAKGRITIAGPNLTAPPLSRTPAPYRAP